MPFDAGGTFTRNYSWAADRDAGIKILAQRMDGEFNNYAGGMNQTFLRTGIVPMGGPLNMNSNPIVGIAGGTLISPGLRFESDTDTGFMQSGPGNLQIVVDGVAQLVAASTGITIAGAFTLNGGLTVNGGITATGSITSIGPGIGGINLVGGNAAVTGYVTFTNTVNGLVSYIGQAPVGGGNLIYSSGGHSFVGPMYAANGLTMTAGDIVIGAGRLFATQGVYPSTDTNFWLAMQGPNPTINFDANDYMRYDRASNALTTIIGGGGQFNIGAGAVTVGSGGNATLYLGDVNTYLYTDASISKWQWDANDAIVYDRVNNQMNMYVGNVIRLAVSGGGASVAGTFNASGVISTPSGFQTVVAGAGNIKVLGGDANVTGYISFINTAGALRYYIGQVSNNVAGAIIFSNQSGGGGHSFTGGPLFAEDVITSGIIKSSNFMYPGNDAQFYIGMSGPNPIFALDPNDYMYYDRSGNQFAMIVSGVQAFAANASAAFAHGIELGYKDIPFRVVNTPGGNISYGDRGHTIQFLPGASNYGVPDMIQGAVVTLVNSSGIVQTLVQAGATIVWTANNVVGNINMNPGAVATILWSGGGGCYISGSGLYR